MESYLVTIEQKLGGRTPKESYDILCGIMDLLENIAYPRRGSEEEKWTIQDVANKAQKIIDYRP